jgi:hypothetical protein
MTLQFTFDLVRDSYEFVLRLFRLDLNTFQQGFEIRRSHHEITSQGGRLDQCHFISALAKLA